MVDEVPTQGPQRRDHDAQVARVRTGRRSDPLLVRSSGSSRSSGSVGRTVAPGSLVLGPLVEETLRQMSIISGGAPSIFLQRTTSLVLLVAIALLLLVAVVLPRLRRAAATRTATPAPGPRSNSTSGRER